MHIFVFLLRPLSSSRVASAPTYQYYHYIGREGSLSSRCSYCYSVAGWPQLLALTLLLKKSLASSLSSLFYIQAALKPPFPPMLILHKASRRLSMAKVVHSFFCCDCGLHFAATRTPAHTLTLRTPSHQHSALLTPPGCVFSGLSLQLPRRSHGIHTRPFGFGS